MKFERFKVPLLLLYSPAAPGRPLKRRGQANRNKGHEYAYARTRNTEFISIVRYGGSTRTRNRRLCVCVCMCVLVISIKKKKISIATLVQEREKNYSQATVPAVLVSVIIITGYGFDVHNTQNFFFLYIETKPKRFNSKVFKRDIDGSQPSDLSRGLRSS